MTSKVNRKILILFLVMVSQLLSCGNEDRDLLSDVTCTWKDPILCDQLGEIRIKNKSTTFNIVRLYVVRTCETAWEGIYDVTITPDESARIERHFDKSYDIRADFSNSECDIQRNVKAPPGGEIKVTMSPNPICNINDTHC